MYNKLVTGNFFTRLMSTKRKDREPLANGEDAEKSLSNGNRSADPLEGSYPAGATEMTLLDCSNNNQFSTGLVPSNQSTLSTHQIQSQHRTEAANESGSVKNAPQISSVLKKPVDNRDTTGKLIASLPSSSSLV